VAGGFPGFATPFAEAQGRATHISFGLDAFHLPYAAGFTLLPEIGYDDVD
jgi:hypothetical protein